MKFRELLTNMSEGEYRELDAFSYSLLKSLDESGPASLLETTNKQSPALEYGTMVDILLTDPDRKDDIFHTKAIEKPTASLLQLADALLMDALVNDWDYSEISNQVRVDKKIEELGLWGNVKDEIKRLEKWNNQLFHDYLFESIAAKGKIITTPELLEAATASAHTLRTHEYTSHYFEENESCEVLKQAIILYTFKGHQGKAKLDLIKVDHATKTIYPIDIKTGSELPSKFVNSFYFFKYYLQVVSYMLAVEYVRSKHEEFKDYKVAPFTFIYISKKLPTTPAIWEVPMTYLDMYANGWDNNRGFISLVDDYIYYRENGVYNTERMVSENNGKLHIYLQ